MADLVCNTVPAYDNRPLTTLGSAFRALSDVAMTVAAVHTVDAGSTMPTPTATINSPQSRPAPANSHITRASSNFAITPQALAADLATRSVRDRPGKWCFVTVGLEPGVYKHG